MGGRTEITQEKGSDMQRHDIVGLMAGTVLALGLFAAAAHIMQRLPIVLTSYVQQ